MPSPGRTADPKKEEATCLDVVIDNKVIWLRLDRALLGDRDRLVLDKAPHLLVVATRVHAGHVARHTTLSPEPEQRRDANVGGTLETQTKHLNTVI